MSQATAQRAENANEELSQQAAIARDLSTAAEGELTVWENQSQNGTMYNTTIGNS